ncbi:hypothetical protein [Lysobacter sp. CA199]|uniref:hypothetical protein n=1 Tax=Lysobacter sp. CA199 TaxID=3455608 RepID=UPI003F8D551C
MDKWLVVAGITSATALLSGCSGTDYATCSGPTVTYPGGKCGAHYYQADYGSGGVVTQALTDCDIDSHRLGGNVVAFHTLKHGIGLRWLDANTLEVSVPQGVELEDQRRDVIYLGHSLKYKYRRLLPTNPEFSGCGPKIQTKNI